MKGDWGFARIEDANARYVVIYAALPEYLNTLLGRDNDERRRS